MIGKYLQRRLESGNGEECTHYTSFHFSIGNGQPMQVTGTVPTVSAHFRSLSGRSGFVKGSALP